MRNKEFMFLSIVVLLVLILSGCANQTGDDSNDSGTDMLYDVYPDTYDAPVIDFIWGDQELELNQIYRVTPYGVWEGAEGVWEPAVEMQFYTKDRYHDPVYAGCEGTLIEVSSDYGFVIIRYGYNYGILYHHVVDFPSNLQPGMKIERGTLIGYTEGRDGIGWWEIEVDVKRGNVFRTSPPIDYFSEESQETLNDIIEASEIWYDEWGTTRSWTISEGDSWIPYLDEPEFWTSDYRLGYSMSSETQEDFLVANNMEFMLDGLPP